MAPLVSLQWHLAPVTVGTLLQLQQAEEGRVEAGAEAVRAAQEVVAWRVSAATVQEEMAAQRATGVMSMVLMAAVYSSAARSHHPTPREIPRRLAYHLRWR